MIIVKELDLPMEAVVNSVSYPLTDSQKVFWYVANSDGYKNDPLIYTAAYHLFGDVNVQKLKSAAHFSTILTNPNVYTYVKKENQELLGIILKDRKIKFDFLDSTKKACSAQEAIHKFRDKPSVSILHGPLMGFQLIQVNAHEYLFLVQAHHFLFDGLSVLSFFKKLACDYNQAKDLEDNEQKTYDQKLKNFLKFQEKLLKLTQAYDWSWYAEELEKKIESPFLVQLERAGGSKELQAAISQEKLCILKNILKKQGTTLNIFFLLVMGVIIMKISGSAACILELPVNIRKYIDTEFYGNYLYPFPIIVEINSEFSFLENLKNLTKKIKALRENFKHASSIHSNKHLEGYYSPKNCRILVNQSLRNLPPLALDGVESELLFSGANGGTLDIQLDYEESDASMNLFLSYKKEKLCSKQMNFLFDKIVYLTQCFSEHADTLVESYQFGHQEITGESIPISKNYFQDTLNANIVQHSNALAYMDREKALTYQHLSVFISKYKRYLQEIGVNEQARPLIAVYMENSIPFLMIIITLFYLKIPLIIIQKREPLARLHYYLENSESDFLFSDVVISDISSITWSLSHDIIDNDLYCYKKTPGASNNKTLEKNIAYIAYTSGSTGKPKGIKVSYSSLNNVLLYFSEKFNFGTGSKYLLSSSPGFDVFFLELLLPLVCGGTLLNSMNKTENFSNLGHFIDKFKPDFIQATPSVWHYLVDQIKTHRDFTIFSGGEALDESLKNKLLDISKESYNVFGPTETTIWSTCTKLFKNEKPDISTPIFNTQLFVFNKNNETVPPGFSGELCIADIGVAEGYLQEELNTNKFLRTSYLTNNSNEIKNYFKTGDRVYLDCDQKIYYSGREDSVIKLNGIRIDLTEIRAALLELEFIKDAQVILHDRKRHLIGFIVLKENNFLEKKRSNILEKLSICLPIYLVPSELIFVDQFPLTLTGKIDKKALISFGAQNIVHMNSESCCVTRIITEVLGVENINPALSFFEQGGTSLLAIDLSVRIADQLSVNINLAEMLVSPTIEDLIAAIKTRMTGGVFENNDVIIFPRDRFEITVLACVEKRLGTLSVPCVLRPITQNENIFFDIISTIKMYFDEFSFIEHWEDINSIAKLAEKCRVSSQRFLTSLVPFKLSRSSKECIVFIHALGGSIWHYVELSRLIDKDVTIIGFESVGLSSSASPFKSIQTMAAYYSEQILTLCPNKVTLVGWCMGTLIADEMSHSLSEVCKQVSVIYINPSPEPILYSRDKPQKNYASIIKLMRESFFEKNMMTNKMLNEPYASRDIHSLLSMTKIVKNFYNRGENKSKNFDFYYKNSYFIRMIKIHYSNLKALADAKKTIFNRAVAKHLFLSKDCFLALGVTDQEVVEHLTNNDNILDVTFLVAEPSRVTHGESARIIADFISK